MKNIIALSRLQTLTFYRFDFDFLAQSINQLSPALAKVQYGFYLFASDFSLFFILSIITRFNGSPTQGNILANS